MIFQILAWRDLASGRGVEDPEPLTEGRARDSSSAKFFTHVPDEIPCPQNLLSSHVNLASIIIEEDPDKHFEKHKIKNFIEIRLPEGNEQADRDVPSWKTFHILMFDCGFCFHGMRLLLSFGEHYSIHPSQLSPFSVCTIVRVETLKELHGFEFVVDNFNELYFLKRDAGKNGYFVLNLKPRRSPLIWGFKSNEGKWKDKYYFAQFFFNYEAA